MAEQPQLPGADWHKGEFRRSEVFTAGAKRFTESQGMDYQDPDAFAAVKAEPEQVAALGKIGASQAGAPQHLSPQLHTSYQAMHQGIEEQFDYLTRPKEHGGMGVGVEFQMEDPYSNPMEMREDVAKTGKLKVLSTEATGGNTNIAMNVDINNKFRAVHDAFGHLAAGRSFSRHGEAGALEHHLQMFKPEAHEALLTDLRTQNAVLNYTGEFPKNRVYDLPDWAKQRDLKIPEPPKRKPEGEQGTLL